jgi:hypothetical protein
MRLTWDTQREAGVLWAIHELTEEGSVVNSSSIHKHVESHAIDLGPISERLAQIAHDADLDPVQFRIRLSLDALLHAVPPFIAADHVHGDDLPIRFDDVRLTERGRDVISAMRHDPEARRPPVGFKPR